MTTKGTDNRFRSLTVVGEPGTPATPSSGDFKLYVADDGTFFLMDDTGTPTAVGGGLSSVTESDLSFTDITTANASTSKHGLLKKLDNNAAHFMDGTGAWSTPSSGSPAFHGAKVYNAGTQTGTPTVALTFGAEEYDTDTFHDTGSNTSRLTVGTTGKYLLQGGTSQSGTNSLLLYFRLNGSTILRGTVQFNGHSLRVVSTVTALSSTDYVELIVTNVGSETYGHASDLNLESWAAITYLGS